MGILGRDLPIVALAFAGAALVCGCGSDAPAPARAQSVEARAPEARASERRATEARSSRARAASVGPRDELPQAGEGRCELGELPGELSIRWPELPRIEREVEASTAAQARAAAARAGTRVRISGAIDALTVGADDVELRQTEGGRVGRLVVRRGVSRVRIVGGRYGGIELAVPARFAPPPPVYRPEWRVRDVTIEGVDVDADDVAFALRGQRIAVFDSRARARRYSVWSGDTADFQTEDLILAGNHFASAGPESTVRLVDVRRAVVVDNVLENTRKHDFRVHGTSDVVYFGRNRLLRTGIMVGSMPDDSVGTVWLVDNVLHHEMPSLLQLSTERVRRLVARNNRVYSDRWSCFVCEGSRPGWEIGDNPVQPFRRPSPEETATPRRRRPAR